ncbi:flavodoxin family protein [Altererythrobacter aquiaggeris]|uniref:flavodoxin family protein n=1 Tax=Aestuarierythrobacter aquiaggeris TaxID=1898396 RepID=UPI0030172D4C
MERPRKLLIIWHSRTGASKAMARAAASSAAGDAIMLRASDVDSGDLLAAGGYLFICPENLAAMSGEMKEMFDRNYYPLLGQIEGRPYATAIAAGSDGEGAQRQIDRIATGWRLRRVADPLIINFNAQTGSAILAPKKLPAAAKVLCEELGAVLSQGLKLGVF